MPAKLNASSTPGQRMPPKLRLKLANDCESILSRTKIVPQMKKYHYHLLPSKLADKVTLNRLMALFESLMREAYENSNWGWNEEEKLSEWTHARTRILVVTTNTTGHTSKIVTENDLPSADEEIVGFMCLRFETGADKSEAAIYVYELHVHPDHQRQGLGQELMRIARVIGTEFKMDKVMLTVFRTNQPALQFYNKLKFQTDKSSPAKNEADYIILSSKIKL